MASEPGILDLPLDVMTMIASSLELQDVSSICCSSTTWRKLSRFISSIDIDFDFTCASDVKKSLKLIEFLRELVIKRGDKKIEFLRINSEFLTIRNDLLEFVNSILHLEIECLVLNLGSTQNAKVEFPSNEVRKFENIGLSFLSVDLGSQLFNHLKSLDLYRIWFDCEIFSLIGFPVLKSLVIEECLHISSLNLISESLEKFLLKDPTYNALENLQISCVNLKRLALIWDGPNIEKTVSIRCSNLEYLHLQGYMECRNFECNFFYLETVTSDLQFSPRFEEDEPDDVKSVDEFCKTLFHAYASCRSLTLGPASIEFLLASRTSLTHVEILDLNIKICWEDEVPSLCAMLTLLPNVRVLTISRSHTWKKIFTGKRMSMMSRDMWERTKLEHLKVVKVEWDTCTKNKINEERKVVSFLGVILKMAQHMKNVQILIKSSTDVEDVKELMDRFETFFPHVLFETMMI